MCFGLLLLLLTNSSIHRLPSSPSFSQCVVCTLLLPTVVIIIIIYIYLSRIDIYVCMYSPFAPSYIQLLNTKRPHTPTYSAHHHHPYLYNLMVLSPPSSSSSGPCIALFFMMTASSSSSSFTSRHHGCQHFQMRHVLSYVGR